jgi:MFS transporter, PHS family, inorganic phosphate transporter
VRTTGHGIATGIGKLGAFIGVFLVPQLQSGVGLRGMLVVAGAASVAGLLVTLLLPETNRRSLDDISGETPLAQESAPAGQDGTTGVVTMTSDPADAGTDAASA